MVGKIVAVQGLRGEVRVQTYTQNPMDFANLKVVGANVNSPMRFVRAVPNSDVIIAKIDGVDDRTAAELLRGTELFVDRAALPAPGANEYYHVDLIGMKVGDNTVVAIHNFGAGDILELDNGDMVSFIGAEVNLENKTIKVK